MGGYGCSFADWIDSNDPQPYNSFGNGSAMRVFAIGWLYNTLEQVVEEATKSAMPTHNHTEGIKGAVVTAIAVFIARTDGKEAMLEAINIILIGMSLCLVKTNLTKLAKELCR